MVEILLPGQTEWQSGSAFASGVPMSSVVGAKLRYPTGGLSITTVVTGVSEPDQDGKRHLLMEIAQGVDGE